MKLPNVIRRWKLRQHVRVSETMSRQHGAHNRSRHIGSVIASMVIAAALVALPTAALAYTKTGVSWTTGNLTIDYRYVNGNFRTALNNSNSNYNAATHVYLKTTDTSGPAWTASNNNYGATGWEGQATWSRDIFYHTYACNMQLNQYYLVGTEPLTRLKVVWEHESGHCLGLDHVSSATHVMYTSASQAYNNGVRGLTTDEINGINTMY